MGKQIPGGNDKQNSDAEVNCHENIDTAVSKSLEVWCICRIVKPCACERRKEVDRDVTPTPSDKGKYQGKEGFNRSTPTPESSCKGKHTCENSEKCENSGGLNDTTLLETNLESYEKATKVSKQGCSVEKFDIDKCDIEKSVCFEDKARQDIIDEFDDCVSKLHKLANSDFELHVVDINTGESVKNGLMKCDDSNANSEKNAKTASVNKEEDTRQEGRANDKSGSVSEGEMDPAKLDSISISSFDHFDASFCSLKSTGNYLVTSKTCP